MCQHRLFSGHYPYEVFSDLGLALVRVTSHLPSAGSDWII